MTVPIGVIGLWFGNPSSIPSGWTRVTAYDSRYPRQIPNGSTNPGGTGGVSSHAHNGGNSHNHPVSHNHTLTLGTELGGGGTIASGGGGGIAASHNHGSLFTSSTSNLNSGTTTPSNTFSAIFDYARYTPIYIKSTEQQSVVPSGVYIHYVGTNVPSGYSNFSGSSGLFQGAVANGSGSSSIVGSNSHTHDPAHGHTLAAHTHDTLLISGGVTTVYHLVTGSQWASYSHTHTVTFASLSHNVEGGETGADSTLPPYYNIGTISSNGIATLPLDAVCLWDGTISSIPINWSVVAAMYDRFPRHTNTLNQVGGTGGSSTHFHAGHLHGYLTNIAHASVTSNANNNTLAPTGSDHTVAGPTHYHSFGISSGVSVTNDLANYSTETTIPPFVYTAFIRKTSNNTPPTFTSQPVATYASGRTRTGPNTTWGVNFTVTDAEQTGANQLQYRIRTSNVINGGTLVASGNCTSGTPVVVTGLFYSSLPAQGNNTLYIHIYDGELWTVSNSFIVKRDDSVAAPTNVVASPNPTANQQYQVTFDAPDTYSVDANEMRWEVRTASNGGGTLIASGQFTQGNGKSTGTFTDSSLSGTQTRWLRIFDGAWNSAETSFSISAQLNVASSENAAINTTDSLQVVITYNITSIEQASINTSNETLALDIVENKTSTENASIAISEVNQLSANTQLAETASINTSEIQPLQALLSVDDAAAAIQTSENADIFPIANYPAKKLRVDIYSPDDSVKLGGGPLAEIASSASYSAAIDEIGNFTIALPINSPSAKDVAIGRIVRVYREGEGLLFVGLIENCAISAEQEQKVLVVNGSMRSAELRYRNALLGRSWTLASSNTILNDLLAGTGWSIGHVDSGLTAVSMQLNGVSIWNALTNLAKLQGVHVRDNSIDKTIDYGALDEPSGIIWRNAEMIVPEMYSVYNQGLVSGIRVVDAGTEIWNVIIPLGAGEGTNVLDLRYSTRNSPYVIQTGTLPNGANYWYIQDNASIAAYGRRERVVSFKNIAPLVNNASGFEQASNMLYDAAANLLMLFKQPLRSYAVRIVGMHHVNPLTNQPIFKLGQKVRLIYRGISVDEQAQRNVWLDVDDDLIITRYNRSFDASGNDVWQFEVTNVPRRIETDADKIVSVYSDIKALQYYGKPYNCERVDGPIRQAANAGYPVEMPVVFDEDVVYLLKAKLTFRIRALRTNAQGVAAGGGTATTTSSGGGGQQTSSAGGGQTSSGGSAHTHTISSASTEANTDIYSIVIPGHTGVGTPNSSGPSPVSTQLQSNSHQHYETGSITGYDTVNHSHSLNDHTHAVHASSNVIYEVAGKNHSHAIYSVATNSEASHTHTIANHTHSVDIPAHTHSITLNDHTHPLQYGIYEAPAPSLPRINVIINGVNVTVPLGGGTGWNTDQTLDITQYLSNNNKQPLRQINTIRLTTQELCDIEVVLRSIITASSIGD